MRQVYQNPSAKARCKDGTNEKARLYAGLFIHRQAYTWLLLLTDSHTPLSAETVNKPKLLLTHHRS
jgi:hypothetical protein